jgi:hypothetical protein
MNTKRISRRALYLLLFLGWASVAVFGGLHDEHRASLATMAHGR